LVQSKANKISHRVLGREFIVDRADVAFNLVEKQKDPETLKRKWRDAISKDLQEMKEKEFMRKFVSQNYLTVAHASKISGCSKSKEMEFFARG
jgi:hypothetical protein